jgi:hypothetical protein
LTIDWLDETRAARKNGTARERLSNVTCSLKIERLGLSLDP